MDEVERMIAGDESRTSLDIVGDEPSIVCSRSAAELSVGVDEGNEAVDPGL